MKYSITKLQIRPAEKALKNRMYIFPDDYNVLLSRFNKPEKEYKINVLPLIMEKIKKDFPEDYRKIKGSTWCWSVTAGCSCGCSPGFIGSTKNQLEIFVDVKIKDDKK